MNKYNEEYYLVINTKRDDSIYTVADEKTGQRGYHYRKLQFGEAPLFFHNTERKQKQRLRDKEKGKEWVVTDVLVNGLNLLVKDYIKDELDQYEIDGLQFYPAVYIDDDDTWYENYWFLNFYEKFNYWDKEQSKTLSIAKNDDQHKAEIDKFCLDEKKLDGIPEKRRLIFKVGGVNRSYVFFHQKVVNFFMENKIQGVRFARVSEFEEGDQFSMRATFLEP